MKLSVYSIVAISVLSILTGNANAALTGNDKAAADLYFSQHPEISAHADWIIKDTYNAASLADANNQLKGNSFWDGYKLVMTDQIPAYDANYEQALKQDRVVKGITADKSKGRVANPVAPLGASKVDATPSAGKSVSRGTPAIITDIVNDSSAKRANLASMKHQAEKQDVSDIIKVTPNAIDLPSKPVHETEIAQPLIHRSYHIDSNATELDRQKAKEAAMVAYVQSQVKPDVSIKGESGSKGDNVTGAAGKDGRNGKDADIKLVNANTSSIRAIRNEQKAQGEFVQGEILSHSRAIAANTQRQQSFEQSTNKRFSDLNREVSDNKKEERSGVASAVAIASMPQVTDGQKFMVSAGAGNFKSESAVAVGASYHAGDNTIVNAGVSDSTNNDLSVGVGVGFGW